MSNELTFSEATLGWRFSHTNIYLKNFEGQWELVQDVVLNNLDHYWNINEATGEWLNQLGEIFDLKRPYGKDGKQFILNLDHLNDPDVVLNGDENQITDDLYRTLIKIRNQQPGKLFCMRHIKEGIQSVFGVENVKVEFRENTDVGGLYKNMYFRLLLTFKRAEDARLFLGLQINNPLILVGKPMGVSYDILCAYDPNL